MATTFSEYESQAGRVANLNSSLIEQMTAVQSQLAAIVSQTGNNGSIVTTYGPTYSALVAAAAAAPSDAALQTVKSKWDKLVADFAAINTKATAIKAAVDQVLNA